jgi:hypothetical protein
MPDIGDEHDLGPCCGCERSGPEVRVRHILMLDRRGPVPGHGWGCFVCGLPADGATAVLCDPCAENYREDATTLRFVCNGWPQEGRVAIAELPDGQPFVHDPAPHAAEWRPS